jgi:hypothetical protein
MQGRGCVCARFDVAVGSDLEILIPFSQNGARRKEPEFATQGCVVHVREALLGGELLVGVQFTGPRFRRLFYSESTA